MAVQIAHPGQQDINLVIAGRITAVGSALPRRGQRIVGCGGRLMALALIDCHTHLVFGGDHADEFEMRLDSMRYAKIARRGGGIKALMVARRDMTAAARMDAALPRHDHLLAEGVLTIEIKSGQGQSIGAGLTMLRAARAWTEKTAAAADALACRPCGGPEYEGCAVACIAELAIPGPTLAPVQALCGQARGSAKSPPDLRRSAASIPALANWLQFVSRRRTSPGCKEALPCRIVVASAAR